MSSFDAALAGMNDILLQSFGDIVEITLSDNTALFVSGVFDSKRQDVDPHIAPSWHYTLAVKTVDVQAFNVVKRNTITVAGVVYTIVDIEPDVGGLTTYVLKRYG